MGLLRIAHQLTGHAWIQMRSGHKTRSAVLGIEGIDHQDAADQRPPIGSILDVHMKPLCQCARIDCSCAHAAELERAADDLTTSSQQRWVDVDPIKLPPSIDEVVNPRRRPRPTGVDISSIGSSHGTIVGFGQLLAAASMDRTRHDDEATLAQLSRGFLRQMRLRCDDAMPVARRHSTIFARLDDGEQRPWKETPWLA